MLAAYAESFDAENPLQGLRVEEVDDPAVPDGWELVTVKAAGLNHHDIWSLKGVGLKESQLPMILGGDAAGVTADGREVVCHGVVVGADGMGDENDPDVRFSLFSEHHPGTHAEKLAVPSPNLIDKPAELTFEQAACLPVAYLTAYRMLFVQGGFKPGDTVLVQGAGGGVSTAAILLGRAAGLRMWVTSRSEQKQEKAVELGAHEAFESGSRLPERVDGVLETVGRATWEHSLRSVRTQGTVVVAGMTSGDAPGGLAHLFFRQLRVIGSTMGTRKELAKLMQFMATSGLTPLIDATYPLSEAHEAYSRMAEGELFGKIVLTT
ncbi:zinc-binding dehydrogenase [Euzebya tangerina]|uniref:zinc-binding dehydrogenase n=1 Tax=Euzebya tangerina TaxID=591198 RepID=UPI000E30C0D0|nr:zinc-binding dehydrogenase [Euzebya tangerina]